MSRIKQKARKLNLTSLRFVHKRHPTSRLVFRRHRFSRLIRSISSPRFRWLSSAIDVLHEASEAFIIDLFQDSLHCATSSNRDTITTRDMKLALRIQNK